MSLPTQLKLIRAALVLSWITTILAVTNLVCVLAR